MTNDSQRLTLGQETEAPAEAERSHSLCSAWRRGRLRTVSHGCGRVRVDASGRGKEIVLYLARLGCGGQSLVAGLLWCEALAGLGIQQLPQKRRHLQGQLLRAHDLDACVVIFTSPPPPDTTTSIS